MVHKLILYWIQTSTHVVFFDSNYKVKQHSYKLEADRNNAIEELVAASA